MKIPLSLLLLFSLLTPLQASDESEPPLHYLLKIGDKEIRLVPGEALQVEGTFENPEVKLTPDKERAFDAAGIRFRYPAGFSFEADFNSEGIRMWTLTGNDTVLILQHLESPGISVESLVAGMKESYGEQATTEPVERKFKMGVLKGIKVTAELAGFGITQEIYKLDGKHGNRFLFVQLSPDEDHTEPSEEIIRVEKLLETTLECEEAPPADLH